MNDWARQSIVNVRFQQKIWLRRVWEQNADRRSHLFPSAHGLVDWDTRTGIASIGRPEPHPSGDSRAAGPKPVSSSVLLKPFPQRRISRPKRHFYRLRTPIFAAKRSPGDGDRRFRAQCGTGPRGFVDWCQSSQRASDRPRRGALRIT